MAVGRVEQTTRHGGSVVVGVVARQPDQAAEPRPGRQQVRGDRGVAVLGEAPTHVADELGQAERLVDDQYSRHRARVGRQGNSGPHPGAARQVDDVLGQAYVRCGHRGNLRCRWLGKSLIASTVSRHNRMAW